MTNTGFKNSIMTTCNDRCIMATQSTASGSWGCGGEFASLIVVFMTIGQTGIENQQCLHIMIVIDFSVGKQIYNNYNSYNFSHCFS